MKHPDEPSPVVSTMRAEGFAIDAAREGAKVELVRARGLALLRPAR